MAILLFRTVIVPHIVVENIGYFDDHVNCDLIQLQCTGEDPPLTSHDLEGALHEVLCLTQPGVEYSPLSTQSTSIGAAG